MVDFFNSMSDFERMFWFIAIPFTLAFFIQSLISFLGLGEYETDPPEIDGMLDLNSSALPFPILTVRNFVVFFTVFGWAGITAVNLQFSGITVILFAAFLGLFVMLLVGYIYYSLSKLTESGNFNLDDAVGLTAKVYLVIPGNRECSGKIQITLNGTLSEIEAVTDGPAIETGTIVKVTQNLGNSLLLVEKL